MSLAQGSQDFGSGLRHDVVCVCVLRPAFMSCNVILPNIHDELCAAELSSKRQCTSVKLCEISCHACTLPA